MSLRHLLQFILCITSFVMIMYMIIISKLLGYFNIQVPKFFPRYPETCFMENTIVKNAAYNRDNELNESVIEPHPNIPLFLLSAPNISSLMPDIVSILWDGDTWQQTEVNSPKFLLYSAHNDQRGLDHKLRIRIIGLYQGWKEPSDYFCYVWYNSTGPPLLSPIKEYRLIDWQEFRPNSLMPYVLTCCTEDQDSIPIAVSVILRGCVKATNLLQISSVSDSEKWKFRRPKRKEPLVGICTPAIYYYNNDFSIKMIEWMELLKELGADRIFFYESSMHENLRKLINYYEADGFVVRMPFSYPSPYVEFASIKRLWGLLKRKEIFSLENIYFTDCVLRYKNEVDFIAHFDPDEMPILLKHESFQAFINFITKEVNETSPSSIELKWWPIFNDLVNEKQLAGIPKEFHILRHNLRPVSIENPVDYNVKSFYNTEKIVAVFSHQPIVYAEGATVLKIDVPNNVAYLAHYRNKDCGNECNDNQSIVEENNLLKYSDRVVSRAKMVAEKIGLKLSID